MSNIITVNEEDLHNQFKMYMIPLIDNSREDIRKKICSKKNVLEILDVSEKTFSNLKKDPKTEIRRSKLAGKYVLSSIYKEAKRLNGGLD